MTIAAVVFDMDGVIIDTEEVWDEVRKKLTMETGGTWLPEAQQKMMGMSSPEWSRYMAESLDVPFEPRRINEMVVERLLETYRREVPVIEGSVDAVRSIAERWPLAIASSSNRPLIDAVIKILGIEDCFVATVSSEEVDSGKPSPDVYLSAAEKLGVAAEKCAAVEDSSNGLRAAAAAKMSVIAIPNPVYPPAVDALESASVVLESIRQLTAEVVESLAG